MTDKRDDERRRGKPRPAAKAGRPPFPARGRSAEPRDARFPPRDPRPGRPAADGKRDGEGSADGPARIAKVMARAGLCSRRDAEAWIAEGRVAVNGTVLKSPALNVAPNDRITVDGVALQARERTRLFAFHKPRGLVTTNRDPEDRPTIFDRLPPELPRLVAVGRLDVNTEGLLLLTNDGGLARILELPATGWLRRYRVRANGATDQAALDGLRAGISIEGIDYAGIEATLDRVQGANVWITMGLREGKNREVKRVLEHLGLAVNRLIRVSYGPFQLGELGDGAVQEIPTRILRDQLGLELAAAAGADFDAPLHADAPPAVAREPSGADRPRSRPRDARPGEERPRPAPGRSGFGGPRRDERAGSARDGRSGGDRPQRRPGSGPAREVAQPELRPRPIKPKPGPRKHISVLRAEERAAAAAPAPRQRVEHGATADRKGRAVVVDRIVKPASIKAAADALRLRRKMPAEGKADRPDARRSDDRQGRPSRPAGGPGREPRGTGAPRGERPFRGPAGSGRTGRPASRSDDRRDGSPRGAGGPGPRGRSESRGERPPGAGRTGRPGPRSDDRRDGPPRAAGGHGPGRPKGGSGPRGERPSRGPRPPAGGSRRPPRGKP